MDNTQTLNLGELDLNTLSKEDLIKLVESKGLVKEFAAEAKQLKDGLVKIKPECETKFELVMNDHNDFAIKRSKGRSWKMLVVMTSQGTAFLKDSKSSIKLTQSNKELLYGFLKGMPRIEVPDSWIEFIEGGSDSAKALLSVLGSEEVMEGYKYGVGPKYRHSMDTINTKYYGKWITAWRQCSRYLKEFGNNPRLRQLLEEGPYTIKDIELTWGIDNARDFIKSYNSSLIVLDPERYYNRKCIDYEGSRDRRNGCSIRPNYNMDYNSFKDYVLYDSVRLGYGNTWSDFFKEWEDTLNMQMTIYRKIKDKYPKNLQCVHDLLSYKCRIMKQEIDEVKFNSQVDVAKSYEATVGDYVFIAPKTRQDFLDEAGMQMNCLASYIQKFIDGDCVIMFMRYKKEPETSLVTIELVGKRLGQHLQARNVPTTVEQNEVIYKWYNKYVLEKTQ